MAIVIKNRAYSNQFTVDQVDFLLGNTGDWQRLEFEAHCSVDYYANSNNLISMDGGRLILSDGTNWSEWGFGLGDEIHITYRLRVYDSSGTEVSDIDVDDVYYIVEIEGDTVLTNTIADGSGTPFIVLEDAGITTLPYNDNRFKVTQAFIYSDKRIEGASLVYSHIQNSDANSGLTNSVIDGTQPAFVSEGMDIIGVGVPTDLEVIGLQSGMSIDSAKYEYIEKQGTHIYVFKYTVDYLISGFYEEVENYEDATLPEYLQGTESLTDVIDIKGQVEFNNPNLSVKNNVNKTKKLGNVGGINENYNGYNNPLTVEDIIYTDVASGNIVDSLSYSAETEVLIVISGVQNLTLGQTKCLLGFQWVTSDESFWKSKNTQYHENTLINTSKGGFGQSSILVDGVTDLATYQGYTSYDGARMDIKNITADDVVGNLVITATYSPTPALSAFMSALDETERNYSLWVSVGDHTKSVSKSDRVTQLIDYDVLTEVFEPVGEWGGMDILTFAHPFDGSDDSTASDLYHYVEDDILQKIYFPVDITQAKPVSITFKVEAEKTNGDIFELQTYSVDLSQFPEDGLGVPQYEFDESRGFKYGEDNNKNWVKVNRYPTNDSDPEYGYLAYYGFKIRWEDWIQRQNVPADFFDDTQKQNGLNNDWYHYINTDDWQVKFSVYIETEEDGGILQYRNPKDINFLDFESNESIETEYVYKDAGTGDLLDNSILSDKKTLIEITHTILTGDWGDIGSIYGTICIEVEEGAGQFSLRQISTLWAVEGDSPFVSLTNDGLLKKELLSSDKIKLSALLDPTRLDDATNYKITSRIGSI